MENSGFREIRRQDRVLSADVVEDILNTAEYGILSVGLNDMGYPYGVPLNFVYTEDKYLYLHGAKEGEKLDIIKGNKKASFCIVRNTKVVPQEFVTNYESVILFGSINDSLEEEEELQAINLFVDKYSPNCKDLAKEHIKNYFPRVKVLKFEIEHKAGKAKEED